MPVVIRLGPRQIECLVALGCPSNFVVAGGSPNEHHWERLAQLGLVERSGDGGGFWWITPAGLRRLAAALDGPFGARRRAGLARMFEAKKETTS